MPDTRFAYSVTSKPNPIHCSIAGDAPHISNVDLLVMISSPGAAAEINELKITIPVGSDDGSSLSSTHNLPEPVIGAGADRWNVKTNSSTVTITPKFPDTNTLAGTLWFTLPRIWVNAIPGNVPITVTESPRRKATTLPELVKLPAAFPVLRFYVEKDGKELYPPVLSELGQTAKIKWAYSTEGKKKAFRLRQVLNGETIWEKEELVANDGTNGVTTPKLKQTSEFHLDVLKPNGATDATLRLTLRVETVTFDETVQVDEMCGGRLVRLRWLALNAARCSLEKVDLREPANIEEIDEHAPTDTFSSDYRWLATSTDPAARTQFTVTAHAAIGKAYARREFNPIKIKEPVVALVGYYVTSMAVTADGSKALTGCETTNHVNLIDLSTQSSDTMPLGGPDKGCYGLAISPHSNFALVLTIDAANEYSGRPIDELLGLNLETNTVAFRMPLNPAEMHYAFGGTRVARGSPICFAAGSPEIALVVPSSREILVLDNLASGHIAKHISLEALGQASPVISGVRSIAITPDGKRAFLAITDTQVTASGLNTKSQIRLIDVEKGTLSPEVIAEGPHFTDLVITPDGHNVLAMAPPRKMLVIDSATARVTQTISSEERAMAVAVTADSQHAFATRMRVQDYKLVFIEIATGKTVAEIPVGGFPPYRIAITSDFRLVTTNYNGNVQIF